MVGDEGTGTKRIVNFQFLNILNEIHIFNSFLNIKGKKALQFFTRSYSSRMFPQGTLLAEGELFVSH